MAILHAPPKHAPPRLPTNERQRSFKLATKEGRTSVTLTVRPDMLRLIFYVAFWVMCFLAFIITKIWVEPMLEKGAVDEPPERQGCGPFNRDTDYFGLTYGEGFTMDETHLTEAFGFNNICAQWDYSPSREVIAMYFPIFEYSYVAYIVLDFIAHMLSYYKGLLPKWYWNIIRVTLSFQILFGVWFRMIFVFIAYENLRGHTFFFLLLQIALFITTLNNCMYVLLTGQSYSSIRFSTKKAAIFVNIYLILNSIITVTKIVSTIYIVTHPDVRIPGILKYPLGSLTLGRILDFIWMFFNAILPMILAYIRMKHEDPFTIEFTAPEYLYDQATEPSSSPCQPSEDDERSEEIIEFTDDKASGLPIPPTGDDESSELSL